MIADLVETAPEPDIAISQQLDTATKSQHVSSSSLVKESPTTNPEKSLSEATNELSDEQKIDSTISHCVAEELTMVTEPGNNLGYVVLVEGINESEVEVPVVPESGNIQLQQSTQGIVCLSVRYLFHDYSSVFQEYPYQNEFEQVTR